MLVLTAVILPIIGPLAAMKGSWIIKVLFLARFPLLLSVATLFLRMRGVRWADLGLRSLKIGRFFIGIAVGFVASLAVKLMVDAIFSRAGAAHADYSAFMPVHGDLIQLLFWGVLVSWTSAAFGEELLFRGFILDAVQRLFGVEGGAGLILAVLFQAMLFGLLHLYQGAAGVAADVSVGFVFGLVWLVSGRNLWPGIMAHGVFDATAMVAIYLYGVPQV
jgi:membrane protease YdiL (CAAX protease family)